MSSIVDKISNKLSRLLGSAKKGTAESGNAEQVKLWFKDKGDQTLRLNYPLNEQSLIMDLGGYHGDWSYDMVTKYRCSILIFEPYLPFYENIKSRFKNNSKIQVFPFGLSGKTEKVQFSVSDDGSSVFNVNDEKVEIQLKSIKEFIEEKNITIVDLVKINIEGGEYDVLEAMIRENLVHRFRDIQVQFHDFFAKAKERMNQIQVQLAKTHELTYQYRFVWENWKLKN